MQSLEGSHFPVEVTLHSMPSAFSLVLETSTPHASVARVAPDGGIEVRGFWSDRSHNAMLFEPLSELLQVGGRKEITLVLVGSGPGSYSGTRVGIAAAQGVALANGCPAVAVPSILAVPSADGGARCMAIGDARRGTYWTALMENHHLTGEPALCDAEELASLVTGAVCSGISVVSLEETGRFPLSAELVKNVRIETPDAARLWRVWLETGEETRRQWTSSIPQPFYLKPPHITPGKRASLLRP